MNLFESFLTYSHKHIKIQPNQANEEQLANRVRQEKGHRLREVFPNPNDQS